VANEAGNEPRLGELLAALSLAGDLANGLPLEKSMRTCLLAVSIGRELGLDDQVLSDTFYVTLLRAIGCTAYASEEATAYGDDVQYRNTYFPVDFGNEADIIAATQTNLARDEPPDVRAAAVERFFAEGPRLAAEMATSACSVAVRFSARLGMNDEVATSLTQIWERWDGKGFPGQLAEDAIAMPARLAHVGVVTEIDHRVHGRRVAIDRAAHRRGGWFDPDVADAFVGNGDALLGALELGSVWDAVLDAEPAPSTAVSARNVDDVASAFGDFVDLKSPFTLGHSSGVARLAESAAALVNIQPGILQRAGWLHDLGAVSVSSSVWNKPGPLTMPEWERVRLHAYYTERIVAQSPALASLAPIVGMHHERCDGSGYHRNATGTTIGSAARVLAAAEVFHALTEARPHRPAFAVADAASVLNDEVAAGRLDRDAVTAVLDVAGETSAPAVWPAGLTDREVEVLRLLARGNTRKQIAEALFISPSTVHTHTLHVYEKTDVSTRAAVALYAMEHDLLRT